MVMQSDAMASSAERRREFHSLSCERTDRVPEMSASGSTISLCMIVKNEEKYLCDCLNSAVAHVDEVIVVDTGSEDRTVEVAKSFGARVFSFQWINDFAAARNESLKHATGDWVLQLDADERLNVLGFPKVLKELAGVPHIDAYVVPIRSYREEQGRTVYGINHNLRFFRRLPGIRYERQVHESVEPFLARKGSKTANASFIIDHFGYHVDPEALNLKLERNLEILEQYVSAEPENAFALYYLGGTYRALGRRDEAMNVLERALGLPGSTNCLRAMTLNAMNLVHMADEDYNKAIETAEHSLRILPHQNTARYFLGAAYYNQGKYREALPYLFLCYQYWRRPPIQQTTELSQEYTMSEPDLLKAMALCCAHQKNYLKTIAFARRFIELNDENPEIYQILGLALINTSSYSEGICSINRALELGMDKSLVSFPMAYAHFKLEKFQESIEYFAKVNEINDESMAESCQLLTMMIGADELALKLAGVFELKRGLCRKASFELLGGMVSALCRFNRLDALATLFISINHRTAELEALWAGVVEYFQTRGRLSELHPVAETLAREFPSHVPFLSMLGTVCIKLGNYFRAIEVFADMSRLIPENEAVRRTLAGLLVAVGNEAQALQILRPTCGSNAAGHHEGWVASQGALTGLVN